MKKLTKLGLAALISATIGLAGCDAIQNTSRFEVEFSTLGGRLFNTDKVEVTVGKYRTYDGDTKIAYYYDSFTNTWNKAEVETHVLRKDSLPIFSYRSRPSEIPYEDVPQKPKGALKIIIDCDKGEEYAYGNFGGTRGIEFQEETLKNAREWAENMIKTFQSNDGKKH